MMIDSKNVVNLDLKKDEKVLNFSDFQKQNLKFDINKLQEAYSQIIQTKKFDDGGGISHFGAICLTRKPGDPDSVKGHKARGLYWTKPDKSGEIQLTDAIDLYINKGNDVLGYLLDGDVYDCGEKTEFILANIDFAIKDSSISKIIKKHLKMKLF